MAAEDPIDVEAFNALLARRDIEVALGFFSGMDEGGRRQYSSAVRQWARDEDERLRHTGWVGHERHRDLAAAMFLATATISELRRKAYGDVLVNVTTVPALLDRRPPWCAEYIDWLLDRAHTTRWGWTVRHTWAAIRSLIEADLMPIPNSPGIIEALLWGRDEDPYRPQGDLVEWLRTEWDLAGPVIDRFFITPTEAAFDDRWTEAILTQTADGWMDRGQVIDAVMAGLRRDDLRVTQLRWLLKVLAALGPTLPEITAREDAIASLLTATLPAVQATAVKLLSTVNPADLCDSDSVLQGLAISAGSRTKTAGVASVALADAIRRAGPTPPDLVLGVGLDGLGSSHAAVRTKATDLIAAVLTDHPKAQETWQIELSDAVARLPVPERDDVATRLALSDPRDESEVTEPVDWSEIDDLPPPERERWGIDTALAALEGGPIPAAIVPDSPSLNPAATGDPVAPIETLDELVDQIGHALEHGEDWLALERCVDGLSRMGVDLPSLDVRYRALLRQVDHTIKRWQRPGCVKLALVLQRQATGAGRPFTVELTGVRNLGDLAESRAHEVGHRLVAKQRSPLLSTPSHSNGWIVPGALAKRILAWPAEPPPTEADLACALMRLHSSGAADALTMLEPLTDRNEAARAVAYALGAPIPTTGLSQAIIQTATDARARLAEPGWCETAVEEASSDFNRLPSSGETQYRHPLNGPDVRVLPVVAPQVRSLVLSRTLWSEPAWARSVAPAYAELAIGPRLALAFEYPTLMSPDLIAPLLDASTPLGPMFRWALSLALTSDQPESQIAAQDAYVALIADGRFDPDVDAAPHVANILEQRAKVNRLADGFRTVAGVSDLHADEVARALDAIVGRLVTAPPNAHTLLELSLELHLVTGRAVDEGPTRTVLEGWKKGGSRRAVAATHLLALNGTPTPAGRRAADERVRLRVERARSELILTTQRPAAT